MITYQPERDDDLVALGRITAYLQGDWNTRISKRVVVGPMLNRPLMATVGTFVRGGETSPRSDLR